MKRAFDKEKEVKSSDMTKNFEAKLNRLKVRLRLQYAIDVSSVYVPNHSILLKRDLEKDENHRIAAIIMEHDEQLAAQRVSVDLWRCSVTC